MAFKCNFTGNVYTQEHNEESVTYAKEHVGTKCTETKILGVYWDKQNDELGVDFKPCKTQNIVTTDVQEVEVERKDTKQLHLTTNIKDSTLDQLLEKNQLLTVLRVTAWIKRFVFNCHSTKKSKGELSSKEIQETQEFWIRRAQKTIIETEKYKELTERLQLKNDNDILICKGRISGEHPIYLPEQHQLAKLVIEDCHRETKHSLVGLTMAKVREVYWIERLRCQVKSVIHRLSSM